MGCKGVAPIVWTSPALTPRTAGPCRQPERGGWYAETLWDRRGLRWISTPIEDSGACLTVENSWLLKAKQAGQLAPQSPVAQSVDVFEWTPVVGRGQVTRSQETQIVLSSLLFIVELLLNNMTQLAEHKADAFTNAVTADRRWQLEDELMCQVFGFTLYGYLFGVGRLICFMDVEDIQVMAARKLAELGIGPNYAKGMTEHAHKEFMTEGNSSLHAKLVGIGHSHFGSETLRVLVDSVFENTEQIRAGRT